MRGFIDVITVCQKIYQSRTERKKKKQCLKLGEKKEPKTSLNKYNVNATSESIFRI